jgi:wyosine [tRNA(Phe)-imidazoG37] synthetase (radical SAM superfamily)
MLDYAERKMPKTKLTFSENGVLLNKENSIRILKSPLNRITLSLDGATKKTYEKLRRNGNFEIVMKNVENFMILKRKINPSLEAELQIIKTTENSNEISAFKRKWRPFLGKNDMITIKEFTTFGGKIKDISIKSLSRKARRFARNLMPCRALWLTLNIHWNGDVVACCLDCDGGLKLGNCKKQTLSEIINGEKMRKLREMSINMSLKKIPLCAGCYGS